MPRIAPLLLVLVSACVSVPAYTVPTLTGAWRLAAVNGSPLPAPSPKEDGVVLEHATLRLQREGSYVLEVSARRVNPPQPGNYSVRGTWDVQGDRLTLTPARGSGVSAITFQRARGETSLVLHDADGAELTFTRDQTERWPRPSR